MTPAFTLDTDTLTLCQENHPAIIRRLCRYASTDVAITVISVEEQLSGWYAQLRRVKKSPDLIRVYDRLSRNIDALAQFHILPFNQPSLERYEQLKALKLNIGKMDLRIAAVVLVHGGVLVTRNRRDFQRVPGLVLEDWTEGTRP